MARPRKCRKVCLLPKCRKFIPSNWDNKSTITLFIDEAEAIRLIDKEGLMQEEAANMMGVARTTVQQIYQEARGKIANALIDGKALLIEGGDIELCSNNCCGMNKCYQTEFEKLNIIAIPLNEDQKTLSQTFSHAAFFALYNLDNECYEVVKNEMDSGLSVARALCQKQISKVITLEIGEKVKEFFTNLDVGIELTEITNLETLIENIGEKIDE